MELTLGRREYDRCTLVELDQRHFIGVGFYDVK
jgi:hypothetical protein